MTTKSLLATGALFLASFSMAYGSSYEVVIGSPVEAGRVELAPGSYRITQKGNEAVFTDLNTGKVFKTPATAVQMNTKNTDTHLMFSEDGSRIRTIALGSRSVDLQLND
jgi:hypothetical protein